MLRLSEAMKRYAAGDLSSAAAAALAGITRVEFLLRLGEFGVPLFDATPEESERERETLRRIVGA